MEQENGGHPPVFDLDDKDEEEGEEEISSEEGEEEEDLPMEEAEEVIPEPAGEPDVQMVEIE